MLDKKMLDKNNIGKKMDNRALPPNIQKPQRHTLYQIIRYFSRDMFCPKTTVKIKMCFDFVC